MTGLQILVAIIFLSWLLVLGVGYYRHERRLLGGHCLACQLAEHPGAPSVPHTCRPAPDVGGSE